MSVLTNYIKRSDVSIFYLFNRKFHCFVLDILMKSVTHLGSWVFSIIFPLTLMITLKEEAKYMGTDIIFTLSISQIIVHLIKRIVRRPRPYKILQKVIANNPPSCQYSFPSGHTCAAFSFAFVLARHIPTLGIIFLLLATLVGISRIYLGFHYPTDVFIGCFIAYIGYLINLNIIK